MADLGMHARAAVVEAMKRVAKQEHFPYEQERIDDQICAVRVFLDGCTYRLLYAPVGGSDQVLLAVHVFQKKDRKLNRNDKNLARKRLKDWELRGKEE
ncbi:type II toxin-antitoxin system RelE/ParE family toxin [Streptomyces sp. C]|uniref:type II toxin-antitoxin system RelE/ParE family toxin n=1 Tax=Streptomyces sp. C TaxID=253839 RepID=UPI00101B5312|nr:type II toxin-antitoxin system RelE/ParE family toxin [Streptomyces sp. C]